MSREDVPLNCRGTWLCDCGYCIQERRYDLAQSGYVLQDPSELDEHQSEPVETTDGEDRDTERCPPPWERDNNAK